MSKHDHDHDHDHDHPGPGQGIIPDWRPSPLPLQVPYGHEDAEDSLAKLKEALGRPRSKLPPDRPRDPRQPSEKFLAFVHDVVKRLEKYNEALDAWRQAQHKVAEALADYQAVAKDFNEYVAKTDLVDTSKEGEFMLEVVQVHGYATDVRIMAHPFKKGGKQALDESGNMGILYSHSKSFVWVIPHELLPPIDQ